MKGDVHGFSLEQALRLSSIKRWGVIEMSREQSVAEHSWNVAVIVRAICAKLDLEPAPLIEKALFHDLAEVITGDIPTSVKTDPAVRKALKDYEARAAAPLVEFMSKGPIWPVGDMILKVADLIDAIQFAERFCTDSRREIIISEMETKLYITCSQIAKKAWKVPITAFVDHKWPGASSLKGLEW